MLEDVLYINQCNEKIYDVYFGWINDDDTCDCDRQLHYNRDYIVYKILLRAMKNNDSDLEQYLTLFTKEDDFKIKDGNIKITLVNNESEHHNKISGINYGEIEEKIKCFIKTYYDVEIFSKIYD